MGRVSNHAKMKMHLANVVLGDEKQSTPCIMAVRRDYSMSFMTNDELFLGDHRDEG